MRRFPHAFLWLSVGALSLALFWWRLEHVTRPPSEAAKQPSLQEISPAQSLRENQLPLRGSEHVGKPLLAGGGGVEPETMASVTAGDILAEPDDDLVRVAKKLSALVVDERLPMSEREEALAHALNLSAGNEAEVLTPLIKNAHVPDSLAETILAEALNRPLSYQADIYLVALGARKSPELLQAIREHLAFLTGGEDRGVDPSAWLPDIKAAKASWPE